MKSSMALLAVSGAVLATGVAVYAWGKSQEDDDPLGGMHGKGECTTAEDVWAVTQDYLADKTATPQDLRDVAGGFEVLGDYCDDNARNMAKASALALRARAEAIENGDPAAETPSSDTVSVPPSPIAIPGGHYYAGFGWCFPGAVLNMATGMCEVNTLSPFIQTSGSCCGGCASGHDCEEDCVS
jgi:hypothetical protein